jgi:hypothetical protein
MEQLPPLIRIQPFLAIGRARAAIRSMKLCFVCAARHSAERAPQLFVFSLQNLSFQSLLHVVALLQQRRAQDVTDSVSDVQRRIPFNTTARIRDR